MSIKHILLGVFLVFCPIAVASAYVDCRETTGGCTVQQLIDIGDSAPTSKEDRINAYKEAIAKINWKIKGLENEGTTLNEGFDFEKNCKNIKNNLWLGRTDTETNGEVSLLQRFLIASGHLKTATATGYYGPLTANAVYRYQKEVLKWDLVTTKSGVGPKTREAIAPGLLRIQDTRCWN